MPSIAELFGIEDRYFRQISASKENFELKNPQFAPKNIWEIPCIKNRYIGIEVEVEQTNHIVDQTGIWTNREDGSLRNDGVEYISQPIKDLRIPFALNNLFAMLGNDIHFSPRTSIHIHLDVRELNSEQIAGIVLTYLAVEPLLYKFVGKNRDRSIFCVPLYQTGMINNLLQFLSKDLKSARLDNQRYAGLNFDALRKFGSLEFRQLCGTSDVTKIMTWINFIFKLFAFGTKQPLSVIIERINSLNTNSYYITFCNDIFEEFVQFLDLSDIKMDLEKGVKAVKQSTISNKFYLYLRKNVNLNSPAQQWINHYKPISRKVTFNAFDASIWRNDLRNIEIRLGPNGINPAPQLVNHRQNR